MPTLFFEGPYRIYFTSHDRGEPPHVHVERDNMIKVWLNPIGIGHNLGFKWNEVAKILAMVRNKKIQCLEEWNEFFGKD